MGPGGRKMPDLTSGPIGKTLILFALPVSVVFFFFQRYLVGGLAVGGVKG